ncbi:hypothetical protein RUM43_000335 [Polyplax serrata]|uniref:Cytochrome P450 n=1 Tax=Polyplax serrata TaxID=468196 RepID=A0AAN8SCD7_POLSC
MKALKNMALRLEEQMSNKSPKVFQKWPPGLMTDLVVSETYTIPKTEDSPGIRLDKGEMIFITISALDQDPRYFPNPEQIDPERFRDEKNTVQQFTYLPFGAGLRHCIAE